MKNKLFGLAGVIGILLVSFLIASAFSSQKQPPKRKHGNGPKKNYETQTVKLEQVQPRFSSGGIIEAYDKIMLFAEVNGVLADAQTAFRNGNRFGKDQVLLHIDDSVYKNSVLSQKSSLLNQLTLFIPDLAIDYPESAQKWQTYLDEFDLETEMLPLPKTNHAKEKYFINARNIYSLYYQIKSMEATLKKYTLRAPFDGVITESDITPGSLVRAGQKLGEFTRTSIYELEAPLNMSHLPFVKIGNKVELTSADFKDPFSGTISRINQKIDRNSQTVQIYIRVSDRRLKDGMYLTADIQSSKKISGTMIPAKWLAEGNKLFIKKTDGFQTKTVHIVLSQGDEVLVEGLNEGEVILAQEADENIFN